MKKTQLYILGAFMVGSLAACNSNSGTAGNSTSDSTHMNPGDSSVTTTTTTTIVHHRYAGHFVPQPDVKYLDLRTHKEVTVRIDTIKGAVVNSETDEPIDLFVAPNSTDTISGLTGNVANHYITMDESGAYQVDTARLNTVPVPDDQAVTDQTPVNGKYKEKNNGNKVKLKTADEKLKEQNGIIKEKDR